jgi:hypothetical protein
MWSRSWVLHVVHPSSKGRDLPTALPDTRHASDRRTTTDALAAQAMDPSTRSVLYESPAATLTTLTATAAE